MNETDYISKDFNQLTLCALRKWGVESQIKMFGEECGEAIVAIFKRERNINGSTREEFLGECVDVELMVNQMKKLFTNLEWVQMRHKKLERLRDLLK